MIEEEDPTVKELRELREFRERRDEEIGVVDTYIYGISEIYFRHWKYVEDSIALQNSKHPYFSVDRIRMRIRKIMGGENE